MLENIQVVPVKGKATDVRLNGRSIGNFLEDGRGGYFGCDRYGASVTDSGTSYEEMLYLMATAKQNPSRRPKKRRNDEDEDDE